MSCQRKEADKSKNAFTFDSILSTGYYDLDVSVWRVANEGLQYIHAHYIARRTSLAQLDREE